MHTSDQNLTFRERLARYLDRDVHELPQPPANYPPPVRAVGVTRNAAQFRVILLRLKAVREEVAPTAVAES